MAPGVIFESDIASSVGVIVQCTIHKNLHCFTNSITHLLTRLSRMTSDVGKHFQIEGGNTHQGYKEFDVAIADFLPSSKKRHATMEAKIIVEGCRRSGIHWLSQMLTDDGNTWVMELQNGGEFNNENSFDWVNKTYSKGARAYVKHKNKWSLEPVGFKGQVYCSCCHGDETDRRD
jgi:hypothetical protein